MTTSEYLGRELLEVDRIWNEAPFRERAWFALARLAVRCLILITCYFVSKGDQ